MDEELLQLKKEKCRLQINQLKQTTPTQSPSSIDRMGSLLKRELLPAYCHLAIVSLTEALRDKHKEKMAVIMRSCCEEIIFLALPGTKKKKNNCLGDLIFKYSAFPDKDYMILNAVQIIREITNSTIHIERSSRPMNIFWACDTFYGLLDYLYYY